jgi:hypothetical protein
VQVHLLVFLPVGSNKVNVSLSIPVTVPDKLVVPLSSQHVRTCFERYRAR